MWQRNASTLAVLSALIITNSAYAQPPGPATSISCSKLIRFEIVLGRVTVLDPRCQRSCNLTHADEENGIFEKYSLQITDRLPTVHFHQQREDRATFIEIDGGNRVRLWQTDRTDGALLFRFLQLPGKPLRLTVYKNNRTRTHEAETLWHLALANRQACQTLLFPCLELLRHNWGLDHFVEQLEQSFIRASLTNWHSPEAEIRLLIQNLDSDLFATRRISHRRLRSYGFAALPYIDAFANENLSSEQHIQLSALRSALDVTRGDTPQRIASWLMSNKQIWITMLYSNTVKGRFAAGRQLRRLHTHPIDFSPNGDNELRERQIEQITIQLAME